MSDSLAANGGGAAKKPVFFSLSMMMFLQYAVWGFWLPVIGRYLQAPIADGGLGFTGKHVGLILGLAASIGALAAPVIGQIADRMFSSEKTLAVMLFLGGLIKYYTADQTSYQAWMSLSILYSVLYVPTIALTNSLAFSHLKNPDSEFPYVRLWGTIGWIAASWIFPAVWMMKDLHFSALPPFYGGEEVLHVTTRLKDALKFAGATSMAYALFSFFMLPHTPPKKAAAGASGLAISKALRLFNKPSFAWLVVASLPISIIHNVYFVSTGPFLSEDAKISDSMLGPVMTVGQFTEIAIMFGLGVLLKRIGFRWVIVMGCLGYFARFAIFGMIGLTANTADMVKLADGTEVRGNIVAFADAAGAKLAGSDEMKTDAVASLTLKTPGKVQQYARPAFSDFKRAHRSIMPVLLSIAFHGFCFGCFFAAAFIYVDKIAEADIRHSAQAIFGIIILGIGPVLSAFAIQLLTHLNGVSVLDAAGQAIQGQSYTNYANFWFALAGTGLVTAILMMVFFRDEVANSDGSASVDASRELGEVAP